MPNDLPVLRLASRLGAGSMARVVAVGDLGFSGRIRQQFVPGSYDAIFGEVSPFLQSANLALANLETPLFGDSVGATLFSAHPTAAGAARRAGFTVLHLANNHIRDYGPAGLKCTMDALREAGIRALGVGDRKDAAMSPLFVDTPAGKLGLLGCGRTKQPQCDTGPYFAEFDEGALIRAVQILRTQVQFVLVSMHMGFMYVDYPCPKDRLVAERLVAAGANLVLMHHAHVLQGVQWLPDGRTICYNLGNWLLDWQEGNVPPDVMVAEQQQGAVFVFDIGACGIAAMHVLPTRVDSGFRIRWATGDLGHRILDRLHRISADLQHDCSAAFTAQMAERNAGLSLRVLNYHLWRGNFRYLAETLIRARPRHLAMLLRWAGQRLASDRRSRGTSTPQPRAPK